MRNDFDKVVTERPRTGGRGKTRNRFNKIFTPHPRYAKGKEVVDPEDWEDYDDPRPTKVGARKPHVINGDYKEFSDLISPLQRYLRSQVGRPWDKVWSEMCQVLKGSGVQAQHIKDHVKWEVNGNVSFPGKTSSTPQYRVGSGYYPYLWVDDHGILRYYPGKAKPKYKSVGPAPKNYTCDFCGAENLHVDEYVRHIERGRIEYDKPYDVETFKEAQKIIGDREKARYEAQIAWERRKKKDK